LVFVEFFARQTSWLAVGIQRNTGSPTFLGQTGKIPMLFERLRVGFEFQRKSPAMVARFFELPWIATGEDGSPRRRALGIRCVGVIKSQSFPRQPINGRSLDPVLAIHAGVAVTPVVGQH